MPFRVLGLSGSLRAASLNTQLLEAYAAAAPRGIAVEPFGLRGVPLYDADLDDLAGGEGPPPAVAALRAAIAGSDALLLVGPEHNWSYSAVLKNAIDWCSRPKFASILAGRHVALGGVSPGPAGTARAQEHLRVVLESVRAEVPAGPVVAVGGAAAEALAVGGPPADVRVALSRQLESLRAAAQGARAEQRARDDQPANAVRSRPSSLAA
jgi:chromate reductase